jgi:hypothetical protein
MQTRWALQPEAIEKTIGCHACQGGRWVGFKVILIEFLVLTMAYFITQARQTSWDDAGEEAPQQIYRAVKKAAGDVIELGKI